MSEEYEILIKLYFPGCCVKELTDLITMKITNYQSEKRAFCKYFILNLQT